MCVLIDAGIQDNPCQQNGPCCRNYWLYKLPYIQTGSDYNVYFISDFIWALWVRCKHLVLGPEINYPINPSRKSGALFQYKNCVYRGSIFTQKIPLLVRWVKICWSLPIDGLCHVVLKFVTFNNSNPLIGCSWHSSKNRQWICAWLA